MESQPQKVDPPKHKKSFFSRFNYSIFFTGLIGILFGSILSSYWGDLFVLLPDEDKIDSSLEGLWKNSGILLWVLLIGYSFFRIFYGRNWKLKAGANFFIGPGLMGAAKKVVEEANQAEIKKETLTELAVHIFWRLTKIGIFGIIVAMIPFMLLFQQNKLITKQNELITKQNSKVDIQNNLIEAERRSSLVFLMSNVLDKVDNEIREQKPNLIKSGIHQDSLEFRLSNPLIARIVSLSRSFKPYRMLDGDTLSNKVVSPERGQLFISLMESQLDSFTQNSIVQKGNFSNAVVGKIDLVNAKLINANLFLIDLNNTNLSNANLKYADLRGADLRRVEFEEADLSGANFNNANLNSASFIGANLNYVMLDSAQINGGNFSKTNLTGSYFIGTELKRANFIDADLTYTGFMGTNLTGVNFSGANLEDAFFVDSNFGDSENLTIEQLRKAASFYKCINLPPGIDAQLRKEKPCLFTEKGCELDNKY